MALNSRCIVLRGMGIECEVETASALRQNGWATEFWNLPKLLKNPKDHLASLQVGDWIFIPGGFSFADYLGSGRLLSF